MISVRLATLQDAAAITAIHMSHIATWEHINADGTSNAIDYEALTLFERWQHGGPWMSIETCAVHLNRLLAGAGFPLVAEDGGQVIGMAEVYESHEPAPFGSHLELSVMSTHAGHKGRGVGAALMGYVRNMAKLMKCPKVIVSHVEAPEFYEKQGFRRLGFGHGVRISAQEGRIFYQSVDFKDRAYDQVKSWGMPMGRYRSSRQEWDKLFPQDWASGIPELLQPQSLHVKITVSGAQPVFVYAREADEVDFQPSDLHVACWAQRPMTPQLLTAVRDWAFRIGYKTLISFMMDADRHTLNLNADIQQTDYQQEVHELLVS
jgi:GNAT superfamily N-acetyltransferase